MKSLKPTHKYGVAGWDMNSSLSAIAETARSNFQRADRKYHTALYETLALVLALRYQYNDQVKWNDLCTDEFWSKRRKRDRPKKDETIDEKTRYVSLYVLSSETGERNDRANKYARVISHLYRGNIPPEDVVEVLKENNGFESMLYRVRRGDDDVEEDRREAQVKTQRDADKSITFDVNDISETADEDDEVDERPPSDEDESLELIQEPNQQPEGREKSKGYKNQSPLRLGIDIDQNRFDSLMDLEEGRRVKITAVREYATGKWKSYRVVKLKVL